MNKNNFNFYVLHYTIELIIAFILVEHIKLNTFIFNYILLLLGTIITLPIITQILKSIPIVNKLVLGIDNKSKKNSNNGAWACRRRRGSFEFCLEGFKTLVSPRNWRNIYISTILILKLLSSN